LRLDNLSAHQLLTVLSWFLLAVLIFFLILIGRLYQKIEGKRTYYAAFAPPVVLLGVATARYAYLNQLGGDLFADLLWAVGGVWCAMLSLYLNRLLLPSKEHDH
jgi:energy-converting hydrogenase Eha subunit A